MHKVFIDGDVFDALAARVTNAWRETPNDVLRRLLDLPQAPGADRDGNDLPGQLGPLIRGGVLKPGQMLTWYRVKRRQIHTATVTALGCLLLEDGSVHLGPDRAATHLCGYPAKGWTAFKTGTGETLAELAEALPQSLDPTAPLTAPAARRTETETGN
jgi:hypothetical protein